MSSPNIGLAAMDGVATPRRGHDLRIASASNPFRPILERFIEARFAADFDASLSGHYPLIAFIAVEGRPIAAAGIRFAQAGPLFLERYLDDPLEQLLAAVFCRPMAREVIAEIGSLATTSPASALKLFSALSLWLRNAAGQHFAVATLGPGLARMLQRVGFDLQRLIAADPGRLGDEAAAWGRYYDRAPAVFAGAIPTLGPSADLVGIQTKIGLRDTHVRAMNPQ